MYLRFVLHLSTSLFFFSKVTTISYYHYSNYYQRELFLAIQANFLFSLILYFQIYNCNQAFETILFIYFLYYFLRIS